ncbi:MAG: outer membrane protein transport protein [Candidatus Rokubacteria bacterium]|nr:outer membrane protein transport protein [Candidatus Rokubacteria bacterium]
MTRSKWWLLAPALLLVLSGAAPGEGGGLSNTETFGGFEFNFNNPGARALGMGGAFIAVADDATAVVTNPAGLVTLQRPEISAEVKFTKFTNTIRNFSATEQEALAGSVRSRDFDDEVTTPSFFSFVYPTERLVVAVFMRELVNFKTSFMTEGAILPDGFRFFPGGFRLFPVKSDLELTALNLGAGVGINLAKVHPLLPSLGASIEFSHGVVSSKLQRFSLATFEGPPDFSQDNVRVTTLVSGEDISAGFNVGALWRPLKDLSLGAVFRRGPRFEMQQTVERGPTLFPGSRSFFDFAVKVPDVYGAGVSYRLFDRLTVGLDVVRIRYSQLLGDFQIIFFTPDQPLTQPGQYRLDDATEVHVGAEYVFFVRNALFALRAGFFTDPDHKIRFTGPANHLVERALFPGGRDQNHYTGGFGVVPIPGLQIDFAVNRSDTVNEFVVSTVFRF